MVKDMSDITNGLKIDINKVGSSLDEQKRVSTNFDTLKYNVQEDFSTLFKINKLVKGLNGVKRETSKVADIIAKIAVINQRHAENFKDIDMKLSETIEGLEVPHDYLVNDIVKANYYDVVSLNKEDGVSINNGDKSLTQVSLNDDTSIVKENLINITTGETVKQDAEEIDNITHKDLLNISNDNELDKQTMEELENTKKINLVSVDNNNELDKQIIDEDYNIRKINMENFGSNNELD